MTASILIPSYRRAGTLDRCLQSLSKQSRMPTEILVVWQEDDRETRLAAERWQSRLPCALRVLHCEVRGVVPAENRALDAAVGEIILLIDDDALAAPDWVERHLALFADPTVGAVGGPADNFLSDGSAFPRRDVGPVGRMNLFGRLAGNMYDQPLVWRERPPREVDHLVGYNLSLRRRAFDRFEAALKPYWQLFELDVCLQVKSRGYRVMFDFGNVVVHWPTNTAFGGGRDGDLTVKIYNPTFNHAFVLARRSQGSLLAACVYQLAIGSVGGPGIVAFLVATKRYGNIRRELGILRRTWQAHLAGLRAGCKARYGLAASVVDAPARVFPS